MNQDQPAGFIFRCSNSTIDECFNKMLFGESSQFESMVLQIKKGTPLFLYNVVSGRLYGQFVAASDGEENIDPTAWEGKFPWQIKVEYKTEYNPIRKEEFNQIVDFSAFKKFRYPKAGLAEEQINKLREVFKQAQEMPSEEKEFREKYAATIRADDGHVVRSQGEVNIDNWLFKQDICHGYERKVPIPEFLISDFHIRRTDKEGFFYLEHWGMVDEKYQEREKTKKALYKKYDLPLVELTRRDLENLDDVLPRKLRPFIPDKKYR